MGTLSFIAKIGECYIARIGYSYIAIIKEEEADTQSLSFSEAVAEDEPETLEFDPDTSTLTFGDGTEIAQEEESVSFESDGDETEISFADGNDDSDGDEELSFGDGDAEDLTFGEE